MEVTSIALSLAASAFGAWIGAWTALDRFKAERSHQRQLEWYEAAHRAITDVRMRLLDFYAATISNSPTSSSPSTMLAQLQRVQDAFEPMAREFDRADFFAPASSVRTLARSRLAASKLFQALGGLDLGRDDHRTIAAKAAGQLRDDLLDTKRQLARDVRRLNKLDELPDSSEITEPSLKPGIIARDV